MCELSCTDTNKWNKHLLCKGHVKKTATANAVVPAAANVTAAGAAFDPVFAMTMTMTMTNGEAVDAEHKHKRSRNESNDNGDDGIGLDNEMEVDE